RGDRWDVVLDTARAPVDAAAQADAEATASDADPSAPLPADIVIIATGADAARGLLGSAGVTDVAGGPAPASPAVRRDVVTLVVAAPGLDDAPRGRAVYSAAREAAAAPESPRTTANAAPVAFAVDHPTAEWQWLAAAASAGVPGRHVLRVALPADPTRPDGETVALAAVQASALLGIDVGTPRAAARRTVELAPPASALGHAERTTSVRAAVAKRPGLSVVGAWLAGSGVAQAVADAVAEVDRSRGTVLWGRPTPPREQAR
ncbi:MAG TPA: hypothetical protein VEP72_01210, partial [Microbacterium sp.]|nr:hypothetical protein [Microbacterium sp.]